MRKSIILATAAISGSNVAEIPVLALNIFSVAGRIGRVKLPGAALVIGLAALLLLWPAFWNVYPLVFSDTGTYLTQAIHRYLGWDRPVFYSLFLYPLHLQQTLWPPVMAQAVLAAWLLHLLRRVLLPDGSAWLLLALVAPLAGLTALPFVASQLMPDVFTPLLVIAVALTVLTPEKLAQGEARLLLPVTGFMIVAHQSHVALSLALLLVLLPLRRVLGASAGPASPRQRSTGWLWRAVLPWPLACLALVSVNLIGHGRASLSPFGNVFLLTRLIYDGPGLTALERNCPQSGWRLCAALGRLPPTSDDFLWNADSPLAAAGGAKIVSAEAGAIILATIRENPGAVLRGFLANAVSQFGRFATGDGLQPWPDTVTPAIVHDFPRAEAAAYAAARQQRADIPDPDPPAERSLLEHPLLPGPFVALHLAAAIAGIGGAVWVLIQGLRRRHVAAGFAAAALLAVLANAAVTGGLSGPHDRYQSRIVWLPLAVALLGVPALARGPALR
jgi:hypothetical protein